jgi:hypothetical protein
MFRARDGDTLNIETKSEIKMTDGMLHREEVEEYVAEADLEYIDEGEINEAIGRLNTGVDETIVYRDLADQNEFNRCEGLAAADFEERAYGRD